MKCGALFTMLAVAVAAAPAAAQITFTSGQSSTTVKQAWQGGVGDFNGDGFHDVAMASPYGTSHSGFVWFESTQGSAPYVTRHVLNDNGRSGAPYFAVGDFNGDGFDDIAASFATATTDTTNYAENLGLYMGSDQTDDFPDESKARGLEGVCDGNTILSADFDSDGDLDLFQVCKASSQNRMFHNDGTGVFSAATIPTFLADAGAHSARAASIGDVNGDGLVDIFVASAFGAVFAMNDGAGSFTDASEASFSGVAVTSAWELARIYDFDGDGCQDFMLMAGLYLNSCDGTDPPVFTSAGAWTNPNPGGGRALGVGDWDGDGDLDALIPQAWGQVPSTLLYTNDGSGSFDGTQSPSGWLTASKDLVETILIDLDNDGDLDALSFERCNSACNNNAERTIHYAINNKDEPGTTAHVYMANSPLPATQKTLPAFLTVTESGTGATRVVATHTETCTWGTGGQARVLVQGLTPDTEYTISGTSAGTDLSVTFTTAATAQTGTEPIAVTLEVPKGPAGSDCTAHVDCESGTCLETGVCGAANGESCDGDEDCISNTCLHDSDGYVCVSGTAGECAAATPIEDLRSVRINGVVYMVTTVEQHGRDPDHHFVGLGPVWVVDGVDTNAIVCPADGE